MAIQRTHWKQIKNPQTQIEKEHSPKQFLDKSIQGNQIKTKSQANCNGHNKVRERASQTDNGHSQSPLFDLNGIDGYGFTPTKTKQKQHQTAGGVKVHCRI